MWTYLARTGQSSAPAGSGGARLRYSCMFLMALGRQILGAALLSNNHVWRLNLKTDARCMLMLCFQNHSDILLKYSGGKTNIFKVSVKIREKIQKSCLYYLCTFNP